MPSSKEHVIRVCLPPSLRVGLLNFQAKNELGECYAALYLLNKALYQEKLISLEVFERYKFRYSRKLVEEIQDKPSYEEIQASKAIKDKERQFSMVLDQWALHGQDWRNKWIQEARLNKDLEGAKLILDLAREMEDKTTWATT